MNKKFLSFRPVVSVVVLLIVIALTYRQNQLETKQAHEIAAYLSQDYKGLIINSAYLGENSNGFDFSIDPSMYDTDIKRVKGAIDPRACAILKQTNLETLNVMVTELESKKLIFSSLYFANKCI